MVRMNSKSKTPRKTAVLFGAFLLTAIATGFGQQVNLTAGPATAAMPDGTVVPMWGYTCGTATNATCAPLSGSSSAAATGALGGVYVLTGGSGYSSGATVSISAPTGAGAVQATATPVVVAGVIVGFNVTNHGAGYTSAPTVTISDVSGGTGTGATAAAAPAWSPVVITVPLGTGSTASSGSLTINLTNNLSFGTGTGQSIPTSIVIVGQVGGGLNSTSPHTSTQSPDHSNAQGCTSWFIAALLPGTPCTSNQSGASPPNQLNRVQSMGTEVGAGTANATALSWPLLKPGTYLLESGTHPSIQVPMGLIGMLVVTTAPAGTTAGTAYPAPTTTTTAASQVANPAVQYNAEIPLEFSEIDPVQNKAVDVAVRNPQFSETRVWSGLPVDPQGNAGCGNPASGALYQSCYPPAVNYTPFYFLINGQAFDRTNPKNSLFAATAGVSSTGTPVTTGIPANGKVLVRLANAGLRMHVPAIVGSRTQGFNGSGALANVGGFTLIAEDGNPVPDLGTTSITAPRVKTEVFMAAGKTYDVMINMPVGPSAILPPPSLPIFDREGSLSANSSVRDAGMLAYISVNGSILPAVTAGGFGTTSGAANPDTYASVAACAAGTTSCIPLVVSDPSKGVVANDVNVYGVALSTPPTSGTLTCGAVPGNPVAGICANGTFTYTPTATTISWAGDTFGYCANGAAAGTTGLCTTVTLNLSTLTGNPSAINQSYTAKTATFIKIPSPGLLQGNTDPNSLTLSVVTTGANAPSAPAGTTLVVDPQGGFTLALPSPSSATSPVIETFNYVVQNSQGAQSVVGQVKVTFPPPSNLQVNVLDAQAYNNCNGDSGCISALVKSSAFSDYRWIIEEDKTFWIDPNCTTNSSINTPGCSSVVGPAGQTTIPTFGVQFHTSTMDFVAQGCTGPLSCEFGQTMLDTRPMCTSPGVPVGCSATSGQHIAAVCDLGNGACRPDTGDGSTSGGLAWVNPSQVVLDPAKRYYISVLPGDAANPFPANASPAACNGLEAAAGDSTCGHTMSGASIPPVCNVLGGPNGCTGSQDFSKETVNVLALPTPLPPGKLSVLVFEDDFPLNGEQDGGGGAGGAIAPVEPGLGGFNIVLWDTYGGLGDVTGQNSNDMFNQPLSNSLAGTIDPTTGIDACPVSATPLGATGAGSDPTTGLITGNGAGPAPLPGGMTGMIVTCPKYEADGTTLSPLAGQAVIANLMPEKFSVQAYPGADRIARGEEWIQTNTLDGQHPHDAFIEIGDPSYFQEYGPAGYHVMIGFANPAIINARHDDVCQGFGTPGTVGPCTNTVKGQVDVERLSRIPDERLYPSESRDALTWTQCWVSLGDPDGEDFQFTKCDANGNFNFSNVPGGNWRLTIGDQWNDQIIDGLSTAANVGCNSTAPNQPTNATTCPGGQTLDMGHIGVQQWQSNLYTKVCVDDNKDGICEPNEIGIPLIYTMIHYRDGHNANALTTDFNGVAPFNETFPLFNWYVVEADDTRYKTTGIHTVYDAGGPADGTADCGPGNGARPCGTSSYYKYMSNTYESVPLPGDLSVPGAVYCKTADCSAEAASFAAGTAIPSTGTAATSSTGRIDPPWVWAEGWAGLTGHSNWIEIGKAPYASCNPSLPPSATNFCATVSSTPAGATTPASTLVGENGGIHGVVAYASTRPFDDASQMIQQPWQPNVPNVTVNLYQEGFAADGVTPTLTMVDTTTTSSWDAWAQGFYPSSTAGNGGGTGQKPYMSCPGQDVAANDVFYFTLFDQPNYLDWYNSEHNGGTLHTLPYNSQFKCYDAMKINNQLQPAPYDGKYFFPSSLGIDPTSGKPVSTVGSTNGVAASMAGTNCTVCVGNPDTTDHYRVGTPMLPPGKYVVEVIMPPGYEVEKEEDKNLLIGDNFIAPVTQQFGGLGTDVFIMPDQASIASMYDETGSGYNGTNYQNQTTGEGLGDELSGTPGFPGYTDPVWPCVGEMRVVPDYLSEFPQNLETAPFAGATRPLCDRKEVTLGNQVAVNARFFIFTSTHIAAKYTGVITDDFTSEFDPFSPQFGEKFAPPNMPISTKDYLGNEISRVYSDHWGIYDGLTFSSWNVNPPNITGYSPAMMTQCMNDPGPVLDTNPKSATYGQMITDPLYNPAYSDFCYINPFMPGLTTYNDTPVVPTQGFVGAAYNNTDCSYPDATPAIAEVDGDGVGPWIGGIKGSILSVNVTNGGSGYTGAPTVSFTGAGGSGATATAVISGAVKSVSVTNHGNYTSGTTPTISFSGGGGGGAAATATMSGDVFSTTPNNVGTGYTSTPTVTFAVPPCGANSPTCQQATGTAVRVGGSINSIFITNHGVGYTIAPAITFFGGGGTGAKFTANLGSAVQSVQVSSGGSGYTSAPTVAFSRAGSGGTTAAGTATESAMVVAVNVTNSGSGYPSTTTVSFIGGGGSGATATASTETGGSITITALGDQQVNNNAYSGPSANAAPFNSKTITRHYGFGSQCTSPTAGSATCNTLSSVVLTGQNPPAVGGTATVPLNITSWSDTSITATVPNAVTTNTHFACAVKQQTQYGGSAAYCGQLVITAGNGKQSIDTVTVTVGGKAPTHVTASQTIQAAIDAAAPGDLIIIDPTCTTSTSASTGGACEGTVGGQLVGTITSKAQAAHVEAVLMWKPVRLQGVGAATSIIDANAFPAGRLLEPWRRHVNCLFGLSLNGTPSTGNVTVSGGQVVPGTGGANPYDSGGTYACPDTGVSGDTWNYFVGTGMVPQVDRVPLEAVLGWDATLNGNLAEQLQEPSLMGAYEGAGITVLGKGVLIPQGQSTFGTEGSFPAGSLLLQNVPAALDETGAPIAQSFNYCFGTLSHPTNSGAELVPNPYPSNFECNPSSIDGLTIRDSSQGGGGIFVHGWNHNLQIANNRINNNAGTLSGGITLGQGEFPDPITVSGVVGGVGEETSLDVLPSCQDSNVVGTHLPYCLDLNVKMHNNAITANSSLGDELFSGTLAGGGGASFCTGSDYYLFNYNWVCGNVSSAEGGGITHLGFSYNGDIEHNTIALNESSNPTVPTNGGGIMIMGTPDTDPVCTGIPDADCPPGLSDGTGPNLVVNGNLIQANAADSGAGGGIRLQQVNGTEVSSFPRTPKNWNSVSITNNIIVNNVAGWDGAGISLQDALNVTIINNTISSNDTLATSGVLTQSIGTPVASAPAGSCTQTGPTGSNTASCPQPSGVSSTPNSSVLTTTFTGLTLTCPTGTTKCMAFSNPLLQNNVIWQNRSFYIGVGNPNPGLTNQQNQVTLFNAFTSTAAPAQTAFGQCGTASYWDVGVRGDRTVAGHESGFTLNPTYSVLDDTGYDPSNLTVDPSFASHYCNGARVPPTCTVANGCAGPYGFGVPPGIVDASAPNPVFTLTPSATVDEGNNWINVSWGPLAFSDDSIMGGAKNNYGGGNPFGNYALNAGSPAIDYVPTSEPNYSLVPTTDFFGNTRPDPSNEARFDVGAVEFQGADTVPILIVTPSPVAFGNVAVGTNSSQVLTLRNNGGAAANGITIGTLSAPFSWTTTCAGGGTNFTLGPNATCTITVTLAPTAPGTFNASLTFTGPTVNGAPVQISGTGVPRATLTSISPTSGARGVSNIHMTLTGTSLATATSITASGGVTCTKTGTPTATSVTANCSISNTATPGTQTVAVVTSGNGTSNTVNFVVTGGTVTFSGPTPSLSTGTTTAHNGTVTVSNPAASTGPVTLTAAPSVHKVGTAGGTFLVVTGAGGGTCANGTVINPGASCTIVVMYTPSGTTTATGNVSITGTGIFNNTTGTATSSNFTAN